MPLTYLEIVDGARSNALQIAANYQEMEEKTMLQRGSLLAERSGMIDFTPHKHVSLKDHPTLSENSVQQLLSEDPTMLRFGEVDVKETERMQP